MGISWSPDYGKLRHVFPPREVIDRAQAKLKRDPRGVTVLETDARLMAYAVLETEAELTEAEQLLGDLGYVRVEISSTPDESCLTPSQVEAILDRIARSQAESEARATVALANEHIEPDQVRDESGSEERTE